MLVNAARHVLNGKVTTRAARRLGLASLILLCGTTGLQTAIANGDTRTLTFHHTHSKEDLVVTFRRNGRYDDAGLAKLNHFLRDWRNQRATRMDPRLFDVIWEVYQDVDGKAPIQIISAYRSPETNAMLRRRSRGVARASQHMLGKAMDFFIPGVSLDKVRVAGLRLQRGGVGYYPTSGSPFVHLDVGSVRHWPRMTRDQLVRVFPNGRTVHVPSDGRPLAGYALALADLQRRGNMPNGVSLAAAQSAGVDTAAKPARTFLAKLFRGSSQTTQDDDEETAETATTPSAPAPAARRGVPAETEAKPAQLAAAVPLPRARPQAPFAVASAAAVPVPAPAARAADERMHADSAAEVVRTRGIWTASAPAASAPRMVWNVGPRGRSADTPTPTPKRRPVAVAAADMTGSLPPWPVSPSHGEDSLPSSLLSYASIENTPSLTAPGRPANTAAPMGNLQPPPASTTARNTTVLKRTPAAARRSAPAAAVRAAAAAPAMPATPHKPLAAMPLAADPWLRGMILSPSIEGGMAVKSLGRGDPRELAAYMRKPATALAMRFTEEPELEADSDRFSGRAVTFLPTIAFGTLTAQLR